MDKQTATCLLPGSPAPRSLIRNESLCQRQRTSLQSMNAEISLSNDMTKLRDQDQDKEGFYE